MNVVVQERIDLGFENARKYTDGLDEKYVQRLRAIVARRHDTL